MRDGCHARGHGGFVTQPDGINKDVSHVALFIDRFASSVHGRALNASACRVARAAPRGPTAQDRYVLRCGSIALRCPDACRLARSRRTPDAPWQGRFRIAMAFTKPAQSSTQFDDRPVNSTRPDAALRLPPMSRLGVCHIQRDSRSDPSADHRCNLVKRQLDAALAPHMADLDDGQHHNGRLGS
jgi:hypothetical protein